MKKFSLLLCIVALVAVMLVGATAFAQSGVTTHQDIFIGEYQHDHLNNSDPNVVIVFGTASVDASANVTERGILITRDTEKWYFPAKTFNDTTGNFGVAIIKATILDGNFDARAYAIVGGAYDKDQGRVVGGEVQEGESIELAIDNVQMSASESEFWVVGEETVNLADYITIAGAEKSSLVYNVIDNPENNAKVSVDENGVVSYVSGMGDITVEAEHVFSGEKVSFKVYAYAQVVEVKTIEDLRAITGEKGANTYAYLANDIYVTHEETLENNSSGFDDILDNYIQFTLDGKGHKFSYNRDRVSGPKWYGLTNQISEEGVIKNVVFEIDVHTDGIYNSLLAHDMRGTIENCYFGIKISVSNHNGNYYGVQALNRYMRSTAKYKNVIIRMFGGYALPICTDGEHGLELENVARIAASISSDRVGGYNKDYLAPEDFENYRYYRGSDLAAAYNNFLIGTGKELSSAKEEGATYYSLTETAVTETPQDFDGVFTFSTEEGLSLNGQVIVPPTYADLTNVVTAKTGSIVFTEADQTEQIKMMFNGEYNEMFTFSSSNADIAKVDSTNGVVTAVAPGNAVITATHIFSGKTSTIPVTFASKVIEVNNAEELTALTQSKITELGATSQSTAVIKLADNISLKKEDMPYYISSGVKYYSVLPYGEYSGTTKETANSTHAFIGVLDGNGYTLDIEFNGEANEAFHGISTKLNKFALVRNLVYKPIINTEMNGTNISALTKEMVSGSYVDNVFCDSIINQKISSSSAELRAFVIGTFKGLVRQTIIRTRTYTLGSVVTNTINTTGVGYFEQVATVNMNSRFATNSNTNRKIYPATNIREAGYYSNIEQLINGEGKKVTSEKLNDTSVAKSTAWDGSGQSYWHTDVEEAQIIGGFTFDKEAGTISMTVNGVEKIVYTKPTAVTVTIEATSSSAVVEGTTSVVGKIDGESSDRIVYASSKPTVAKVSSDGIVTGVAAGSANIYAIDTVTGASTSIKITVTAA